MGAFEPLFLLVGPLNHEDCDWGGGGGFGVGGRVPRGGVRDPGWGFGQPSPIRISLNARHG